MDINKIYKKDNLELSKMIDSNSVDLIYSDILYGANSKDIKDYDDTLFKTPTDAIKYYKPLFTEFKRILKEDGSLYIHCDWHLSHYMKVLLDQIFGIESFKNDICRQCTNAKNNSKNWGRIYDNILFYTKSPDNYTWNFIMESKTEAELEKQFNEKIQKEINRIQSKYDLEKIQLMMLAGDPEANTIIEQMSKELSDVSNKYSGDIENLYKKIQDDCKSELKKYNM